MVNAGRATCLVLPFLLSSAALVCLVLVILGGMTERNSTLDSLYFLKVDTTNFTDFSTSNIANLVPGADENSLLAVTDVLKEEKTTGQIADYYTVYLENYCSWNGDKTYSYCSPREKDFAFDPIQYWGLNAQILTPFLPASFTDGVNTYKKLAITMYNFYMIALVCSALVLPLGVTALFSKWGSFFTTAAATLAGISAIVASTIATVLFSVLSEAINHSAFSRNLGFKASLGQPILRITWLSVLFAGGAWIFWFFSICCCSARSPYKSHRDGEDRKRVKVEKTPYTYERVGSPYLGPRDGQNVPLQTYGQSPQPYGQQQGAYEPFRSQQV